MKLTLFTHNNTLYREKRLILGISEKIQKGAFPYYPLVPEIFKQLNIHRKINTNIQTVHCSTVADYNNTFFKKIIAGEKTKCEKALQVKVQRHPLLVLRELQLKSPTTI